MKKMFFSVIFVFFTAIYSFASNVILTNCLEDNFLLANNNIVEKQNFRKDNVCRVTCSVSMQQEDGTVYTLSTSAGSIFTSCPTAHDNCNAKLAKMIGRETLE